MWASGVASVVYRVEEISSESIADGAVISISAVLAASLAFADEDEHLSDLNIPELTAGTTNRKSITKPTTVISCTERRSMTHLSTTASSIS